MADYDLSGLTHRSFEQLVQALAGKVLGPGIMVFGDGPDGGREATFEREVPYPTPEDRWDGYGVIQAKYRQRLSNRKEDGKWAVEQLKEELKKYTEEDSQLRRPDYFVYATNVVLTPVRETGSKDRIIAILEDFKRDTSLKDYAIWDCDQIRIFLDGNQDIRNAYAAFITSGDVLARIISRLGPRPQDLYKTLTIFLEKELLSDECVNLEQAGHSVEERIPLATVFVDLPTHGESPEFGADIADSVDFDTYAMAASSQMGHGFVKRVLAASSERLDPASRHQPVLSARFHSGSPRVSRGRFVLIGGPGQGKTTLTQFICQIFRAAVISEKPVHTLLGQTQRALQTIRHHCNKEDIDSNVVPRFPFKLLLSDFATVLSSSSQVTSVLGYLSLQMEKRTDTRIAPEDLRRFLGQYPSVIVFDGLDEVPASSNRGQVMDAIRDFWIDASNVNADILSIATSRPQGYSDDFSPLNYQHCHLAELSEPLGWHYAKRLAKVRFDTDEDRRQKVLSRLKRALGDPSTSRLMRSPLQVTIMTALVDRIGRPPQARWELFHSYYGVIYDREVERSIPTSNILRDYRRDIKAIHNHVGLVLQIDSERTGKTDAKLSSDRFLSLVEARLKAEGHAGEGLTLLAQQVVEAASQRLVFLVEVEANQIGFEIRSLQEFMAAECLMDGAERNISKRLKEIAPLPGWRNVFLFAAGKCFAQRQDLRDVVHTICATLNEIQDDALSGTLLVGADLAIALLAEGSCRHQPRFEGLLARVAIRALDKAKPMLQIQLAEVYEPRLQNIYEEELVSRLTGKDKGRSIGAWNCLLRLVVVDVSWALDLANKHWPQSDHDQVRILQVIAEPTRNWWAAEKLLELIPKTPIGTFVDVLRAETTRRHWLERHQVEPTVEAAVFSQSQVADFTSHVRVLGSPLSYGPVVRIIGNGNANLQHFRSIPGWHTSWLAYKHAGDFLKAPSRDSLADALTALARGPLADDDMSTRFGWRHLPWPILACLDFCNNSRELLRLAHSALQGELGDVEDWVAAESRWFERGIGRDDLLTMSNDRLPFDATIRESGFPTTLSVLTPIMYSPHHGGQQAPAALEDTLDTFDALPSGTTRVFVAGVINWLLLASYVPTDEDDTATAPTMPFRTLKSIYREVPSRLPVPVHTLVSLMGQSITDATALFAMIKDSNFYLHSRNRDLVTESVKTLKRVYTVFPDDASILSILGAVAERGQLEAGSVDVMPEKWSEEPDEYLAAFLVRLSQETWDMDSSKQLLAFAQQAATHSSSAFNKTVNTLANGPVGPYIDGFLVGLKELVPTEDYKARIRYVSLLDDALGRKTSRFTHTSDSRRFALPEGIVDLLHRES